MHLAERNNDDGFALFFPAKTKAVTCVTPNITIEFAEESPD